MNNLYIHNTTEKVLSRSDIKSGAKVVENNLLNRFSVKPLAALPQRTDCASSKKSSIAPSSTSDSERGGKIAKVAAAIIGISIVFFAACNYLPRTSSKIDCESLANAKTSGEVSCQYKNGAAYEGSVENGLFSGNGCYTNPSGKKFCGEFEIDREDESSYLRAPDHDELPLYSSIQELDECILDNSLSYPE